MRVCYFVSEYPANSHTFIRREIAELERTGVSVLRVSLRSCDRQLADPYDIEEKARTRYILEGGIGKFVAALANATVRNPGALVRATISAITLMRRSSRPAPLHLVYLAEALVLARWVREAGVWHIHAHFGTNGAEVAMLCHLLTGIPYSFTVHGPDEFDRPEYLGLPTKVKHAAFVCAVSSFTRSQLCRWIPPDQWTKIKVVRCGLDGDFLDAPPPRHVPRSQLVTVGRLSEQKGQLVLLRALAVLAREGVPFKLTVIGDGPLRHELEHNIRVLRLDQHVELVGWMSSAQVRAAICEARALVLPSFAEGLPVVLMEALALGRPVITTYIAGIPELVTDQVSGWLVPAGSVDKLADAIRQCLNTPDALIQIMGVWGRKRVLEQHDIVWECRKLAALFKAESVTLDWLEPIGKHRSYEAGASGDQEVMSDHVISLRSRDLVGGGG
ncbi:MAG TPA: glycosyltransferase [Beijerinckiaceae bacterium]|jgi:glycosyltransferase involved in cell wall biosynthesis|nr:glycosyltransferase [Beijerinckiaceae bacterium]